METTPNPATQELPAFPAPPRPPPSLPAVASGVRASEMEIPGVASAAEEAAGVWEWGSLLDFTIEEDDPLIISWDSDERPMPTTPPPPTAPIAFPPPQEASPGTSIQTSTTSTTSTTEGPRSVRKRDPRLTCENFLAGRVPCSCPEVDEKGEEEEVVVGAVVGGGRKRVRTGVAAVTALCQVPGCGADIRELKGYHRRHRVCLLCANAESVVLDGEPKRYCQQCGKFHILPDFDEGKRSCRRKLERHNKRRRRRSIDYRSVVEKEREPSGNLLADVACDKEPSQPTKELLNGAACGMDSLCISNKTDDTETLLAPENGHGSPFRSVPSFHTIQSDSVVSFAASGETQMDERIDNSKSAITSSFCDNKNAYSSMCPTGRISFKLYDWNPAEFPRRLRHQIFQWLASMPVELEGYIRPGCTILTVFIAMPQFMWEKLSKEPAPYVNDLVKSPESLFSGRGNILIYLNNMIFQVMKDGTSLTNIKMEVQVPRLHYVHPTYFEAGKPMEFIACGSNLLHPKFRFLVSFAGKYLQYESCNAISHGTIKACHGVEGECISNSEHEILRIRIPYTESELFGPAFIEVENEFGVSNFIAILFGNRNICSEMERIQEPFSEPLCSGIAYKNTEAGAIPGLCEGFVSRQTAMSELLLDIAWLLKEPWLDRNEVFSSSVHIQRLNCLLKHLLQNESVSILEKIVDYLDILVKGKGLNNFANRTCDTDMRLFGSYMDAAREIIHRKPQLNGRSELDSGESNNKGVLGQEGDPKSAKLYTAPIINHNGETRKKNGTKSIINPAFEGSAEDVSLINKENVQRADCYPRLVYNWQQESWAHSFSGRIISTRLAVLTMVSVVTCCGICVALLHPHKAGEFAVSVRRCLLGWSRS